MSHEIETFNDGSAAFFSARVPAWHHLGTVTTECLTAEQVMDTAYLGNWDVRKTSLATTVLTPNGVSSLAVPDKYATVRTNPRTGWPEVLGVVGNDYTPVQNEECCELLNILTDESGAHFETAGSLQNGRRMFVTMKLPDQMRIGGIDDIDLYLAATTSHDGTAALRIDASPVRIVCANTLRAALRESRSHYSFRHTSGTKRKLSEAREALGLMWAWHEEFQASAERMINETLTYDAFTKITEQLWPQKDEEPGPRTKKSTERRVNMLRNLFCLAATQETIRGTRWAGYQAVVEYLDHYTPAKDATVRATRTVASGAVADLKARAFDLLTV